MVKNHMKRYSMPNRWSLPKKTHTWVVRPAPGPHPAKDSIPVGIVLRDYLHLASNIREAKKILSSRKVKIDGRIAKDIKRGLGFMDVLSLEGFDRHYRVLLDKRGKIRLVEIPADHATWKLCRINGKHSVKGGKVQLGLHDGRSILLERDEATKYRCGDTIKISLPDQKIVDHYPFKEGYVSMIIGGRHAGTHAVIVSEEVVRSNLPNRVILEGDVRTIKDYVFVVGKSHPEVVLPEVE